MLLIVAFLVVLASGVVAVLLVAVPPTAVSQDVGPADAAAAGPDVARVLAGLAADPAAGVAAEAREELNGRAREAIPEGSVIQPFADTWAPDGLGGGTMLVDVTTPGQNAVSYLAVMVPEDGTWKVLATIAAKDER